jgi:hypothetical protein
MSRKETCSAKIALIRPKNGYLSDENVKPLQGNVCDRSFNQLEAREA